MPKKTFSTQSNVLGKKDSTATKGKSADAKNKDKGQNAEIPKKNIKDVVAKVTNFIVCP